MKIIYIYSSIGKMILNKNILINSWYYEGINEFIKLHTFS